MVLETYNFSDIHCVGLGALRTVMSVDTVSRSTALCLRAFFEEEDATRGREALGMVVNIVMRTSGTGSVYTRSV